MDDDEDVDDNADDVDADAVDDASDPGKATGFGLFLFHMSKVSSCKWRTIQWKNEGKLQWKGEKFNEMEEIQKMVV